MGLRWLFGTAGVQVVDEQRRHERLGGVWLEDLDPEPRRALVRRG
jgi:hypothetical protein